MSSFTHNVDDDISTGTIHPGSAARQPEFSYSQTSGRVSTRLPPSAPPVSHYGAFSSNEAPVTSHLASRRSLSGHKDSSTLPAASQATQDRYYTMPVRLSFSIVCEGGSDMLGPKSKGNVHIRGPRTDRKEHDSYIWVESVQPTKGPNGLTETFTTEDWNRALSSAQAPERKRFLSLKDLQASLSLGTPHKLKPMFCSAHGFSLLSQAGNEGSFPGRCQPRNAYTTRLKEFDYPQELVSTEGYKQAGLKARLSRQGHTLTCGQSPGSMILSANMCTEIRLIAARPHDNHGGDSWYSDAKHGEPPEGQQKQGKIFYVDGKIAWYHNPSLWSRCGVTSGGLGSMAATGPEVDFEAGQFGGPETSTMTESRNQQHPLGDHQLMTEAIWSDTAGDLLISVPSCDGYTAATSPQDRIEEEFEIGEEETIGGSTTWVDPYDRRDHSRRGSI